MPLGRRPLLVLLLLPVLALLAGLLAFGGHADGRTRTVADVSGDACTQHAPRFGITDDPAEVERQRAFERSSQAITAPGFSTRPAPAVPTLHAASHSSIVVFYRQGLPAEKLAGLRDLVSVAVATQAPVVVTPRRQAAALTALGLGQQLTCATADAAQVARVRAFAAAIYPSLKR
jgi:Protein of unknown function (DUF3105)